MTRSKTMMMPPLFPEALKSLKTHFKVLRCDEAEGRKSILKKIIVGCREVINKGHDTSLGKKVPE